MSFVVNSVLNLIVAAILQCETAEHISPAAVLSTSREDLRACGLSGQKVHVVCFLSVLYVCLLIKLTHWNRMRCTVCTKV
jgi:hypothetical protein